MWGRRISSMSACGMRWPAARLWGRACWWRRSRLAPPAGIATRAAACVMGCARNPGWSRVSSNSADEARMAVRFNLKYGADVIKTCATGGVLSPNDEVDTPQLTQAELDALVDEAHALRRKTAAHAHGATGAKRAIRAGIDSIEHGSFLDDETLRMMKAKGTFYVPTLIAGWWIVQQVDQKKLVLTPAVVAKARAAWGSVGQTFNRAVNMGV